MSTNNRIKHIKKERLPQKNISTFNSIKCGIITTDEIFVDHISTKNIEADTVNCDTIITEDVTTKHIVSGTIECESIVVNGVDYKNIFSEFENVISGHKQLKTLINTIILQQTELVSKDHNNNNHNNNMLQFDKSTNEKLNILQQVDPSINDNINKIVINFINSRYECIRVDLLDKIDKLNGVISTLDINELHKEAEKMRKDRDVYIKLHDSLN
jgi:hypothetical protein